MDTFSNERGAVGNYKLVPETLLRFLDALRHNGNVSLSARMISSSRSAIYAFAAKNPAFQQSMKEAINEAREFLLGEAWRRALNGVERPVWYRGERIGTQVERSDSLLNTLIKGYYPELGDRNCGDSKNELLIPDSADLTKLSDSELEVLEKILLKLEEPHLGPG